MSSNGIDSASSGYGVCWRKGGDHNLSHFSESCSSILSVRPCMSPLFGKIYKTEFKALLFFSEEQRLPEYQAALCLFLITLHRLKALPDGNALISKLSFLHMPL